MHDAALLRRYAESGSEDAFGAFVSDFLPLVYGAALRRVSGDAHLAQEVAQLVFTAASRDAVRLSRHPDIVGWLFTTTRFLAAKAIRTEQRRRVREHAAWVETDRGAENDAWMREASPAWHAVLDDVLMELQQLDRQMLLLRFYRGLRLAEIGAQMNSSENAVQKRIERALERLREKLSGRGITSTAVALAGAMEAFGAVAVPAGLATAATTAGVACGAGGTIAAAGMTATVKAVLWSTAAVAVATTGGVAWYQRENTRLQVELAKESMARAGAEDRARREREAAALAVVAPTAQATRGAATAPGGLVANTRAAVQAPSQMSAPAGQVGRAPSLPARLPDGLLVPLRVQYPKPLFAGTPPPLRGIANLEPARTKEVEIMVPGGTALISRNAPVSSSDPLPVIGELAMINDGDKSGTEGGYLELGPGLQWVQLDLGQSKAIHAVAIWHFHAQSRVYHDVVVQLSDDKQFRHGVTTLFNNDDDGSSRLGKGTDKSYVETYRGRVIQARGFSGRYVRFYSNGNTSDALNHYCEVEVFGTQAK